MYRRTVRYVMKGQDECRIRSAGSTAGIASIDCTIVERRVDGTDTAFGGCGAHPDSRVALLRAITEAAQSRVTLIQGGREDLAEVLRERPEDRIPPHTGRGTFGPRIAREL
jgi:YcaO-like protein with predicted kinase domain